MLEHDSRTPNRLKMTLEREKCILLLPGRFGDTILHGGVTSSLNEGPLQQFNTMFRGVYPAKHFTFLQDDFIFTFQTKLFQKLCSAGLK